MSAYGIVCYDTLVAAHRAAPAETLPGLPPLCPPFWRGRMGLDKAQQLALISKY